MRRFSNLPFKQKLLWMIIASSFAALVLGALGFVTADLLQFGRAMPRDLQILAQIIAVNARSPLRFNDAKFARETLLGSLAAHPRITRAAIFDEEGTLFADYTRPDHPKGPIVPLKESGHRFERGHLLLQQTISEGKEVLGRICLEADLADLHARLRAYTLVTVAVLAIALAGSFSVGLWLQRFLARPVEALARTAQDVMGKNDYRLRAMKFGEDELGSLTDTFNRMLAHIETQDADLRFSREKLESIINSTPGIVWEADPDTASTLFVSNQAEVVLGYPTEAWLSNPKFREERLHPDDRASTLDAYRRGVQSERPFQLDFRMMAADGRTVWMRESISVQRNLGRQLRLSGVAIDITEQKLAAEQISQMQQELIAASRMAGMAEVATGVLHNVGNVLNSVSVSSTLVADRLRRSEVSDLQRAANLMRDSRERLPEFLTMDPRGRLVPEFLYKVTDHLVTERDQLVAEMASVTQNVEHIKEIVAMQQTYAKVSGALESLNVTELVEAALELGADGMERHRIEVVREYEAVPPVLVDRHKVLQILLNLISNAKHALHHRPEGRRLTIRVGLAHPTRVRIQVMDNGVGIPKENLTRIFQHGFTTKATGHGFGLHSGALAAKEIGGSLAVQSDGPGHGATFTVELPVSPPRETPARGV